MNKFLLLILLFFSFLSNLYCQANNEFYNNGSVVHIQAGSEVHVLGDVHMRNATGLLENNGLLVVQGDLYSDNLFQQRGTGTTRLINNLVNIGQTQFISGSYAVRGGQASIGVNDGSFYNLELANDQGIVWLSGSGNISDVRNSVDFNGPGAPVVNRIITHDPLSLPANGNGYFATFGIMNTAVGLTSMLDNTVSTNGNSSAIDNGYIQGKLRRAISPAGGSYGFVLGLEPAGAGAQRGMQYSRIDFAANTYDVVSGYFQTGSFNSLSTPPNLECSGYDINYFGGQFSGQWNFNSDPGTGLYELTVWPQDDNLTPHTVWVITQDEMLTGTPDDCGPSPVGLSRSGYNGSFGEFGVAASDAYFLPAELINIWAESKADNIQVNWKVGSENNVSHYTLERSVDGLNFNPIATLAAAGFSTTALDYKFNDFEVERQTDYYYRYRSVDFDGFEENSPIVHGRLADLNEFSINLFPNPAMDDVTIYLESDQNRLLTISLIDNLGKLIANQETLIQKGSNAIPVNVELLSDGVYTFRFEDAKNSTMIIKRFIKN